MENSLNYEDIGARIRVERENLNLSREKFAEIVELSSFYIGQIERGERRMSLETLAKIAKSLRISIDYLLFGINKYDNSQFLIKEINTCYYELDKDLIELLDILSRCSKKEIYLIKDIIKLMLPHLKS